MLNLFSTTMPSDLKVYALTNLWGFKSLHDRGIKVPQINDFSEGLLDEFIFAAFGRKNVVWESFLPKKPRGYDKIKDKEEYEEDVFFIDLFLERDHAMVKIWIDDFINYSFTTDEYKQLIKILKKMCSPKGPADTEAGRASYSDFPYELFNKVDWFKKPVDGKLATVGVVLYFIDLPFGDFEESPIPLTYEYEIILEFVDKLREIRSRKESEKWTR